MLGNNDYFVRQMFRKYLLSTVLSVIGFTAVGFFNTLLAGRYLGQEALAIMNFTSSFSFLFSMLGCLINVGAASCAAVAMGQENYKKMGVYVTLAFLLSVLLSLVVSAMLLISLKPLFVLMGAEETLYVKSVGYARLLIATGFLTTLAYFPFHFLRLDGRGKTSMAVYLIMGMLDVALVFLALRGGLGLVGLGGAAALAAAIADITGITLLFLGKNTQIHMEIVTGDQMHEYIPELVKKGSSSALNNLCNMMRTVLMNSLIVKNLGADEVGVFAVGCAFLNLTSASVGGFGQAVAPVMGVFYGEKDQDSIRMLMKNAVKGSLLFHAGLFLIMLPLAQPLSRAFGITQTRLLRESTRLIRWMALSLVPASVLNVCIYYYMTVDQNFIALTLTFLRAFALVSALTALCFSAGYGEGYIIMFLAAEATAILFLVTLCRLRQIMAPGLRGLLLLNEQNRDANYISFSVQGSVEGAVLAAEKMRIFCEENHVDFQLTMMLPLTIEELLVVMNEHCLGGNESSYADVRILFSEKELLLRIRCGGKIFDPVAWYQRKMEAMTPKELLEDDSLGIRMVAQKAKSVQFKRTFGMNHLIVVM